MSATTIQDGGDFIEVIAPSGGVVSGQPYVVGNVFGVAQITAAQGERVTLRRRGIVTLPKATGGSTAFTANQRVWWHNTNRNCVNASAQGLFMIGTAAGIGLDYGTGGADGNTTLTVLLDGITVVAVP